MAHMNSASGRSVAIPPEGRGTARSGVRVVQARAEQLAQLAEPVADGLRVHAELGRDGLHLARAVQPRAQRLGQPRARAVAERVQRREP